MFYLSNTSHEFILLSSYIGLLYNYLSIRFVLLLLLCVRVCPFVSSFLSFLPSLFLDFGNN